MTGRLAAAAFVCTLLYPVRALAQDAPPPAPPETATPETATPPASDEQTGEYAPPSLTGEPPAMTPPPAEVETAPEETPATAEQPAAESTEPTAEADANPPPPIESYVPPAMVGPAPERPFLSRFGAIEIGLMAASLFAGWVAASAVAVVAVLGATSLASGRLQWDLPRTLWSAVRDPRGDTPGSRLFAGQAAGIMAGGLLFSILAGAFSSGAVATLIGLISQDWETSMGPVVASGLLAAGIVAAAAGTGFVVSLLIPVPIVWIITFGLAAVVGVIVPPVAVVIGQALTKRARTVPGGLITSILQALPMNPLTRPSQPQ